MKRLLSAIVFALVLGGCLAREVVATRTINLDIEERPCFLTVTVDGEVVQTIDGRKHGVNCPISIAPIEVE